jgi:hypothetical protein
VSGQLHSPAALPPGHIGYDAAWAPGQSGRREEDKILAFPGFELRPALSLGCVTDNNSVHAITHIHRTGSVELTKSIARSSENSQV